MLKQDKKCCTPRKGEKIKRFFLYGSIYTFSFCASFLVSNLADSNADTAGLTLEEDSKILPAPPGQVSTVFRNSTANIKWEGTRDDTVAFYVVYRKCQNDSWSAIAKLKATNNNQGVYEFSDKKEGACKYAISAINLNGKEGPKSTDITN
jgi:hypothetical protein